MVKFDQIWQNLAKHDKTWLFMLSLAKLDKTWLNMAIYVGKTWLYLEKLGQTWQIKHG